MALVPLSGAGLFVPPVVGYLTGTANQGAGAVTLDADEEEYQIIYDLHCASSGNHTFGLASTLGWLPGTAITFAAGSTLRVGLKAASKVVQTAGPPFRATPGAAAFDIFCDLVGGTHTIADAVWRQDGMTTGTPLVLSEGTAIVVAWHLNVTSGTPSVKIRSALTTEASTYPAYTLITAGPVFTPQTTVLPNVVLTCDDGVLAWGEPSLIYSANLGVGPTIGLGNSQANVFRVPFACCIDAVMVKARPSTNAANLAFELYASPLGTPTLLASLTHDANVLNSVGSGRMHTRVFAVPQALAINTEYALGVRQDTATAVALEYYEVFAPGHFLPNGLGEECYAAHSTAGATFVQQPNALGVARARRYQIAARVSHLDNGLPLLTRRGYPYGRARQGSRALYTL